LHFIHLSCGFREFRSFPQPGIHWYHPQNYFYVICGMLHQSLQLHAPNIIDINNIIFLFISMAELLNIHLILKLSLQSRHVLCSF
jgi:hypothetical protein